MGLIYVRILGVYVLRTRFCFIIQRGTIFFRIDHFCIDLLYVSGIIIVDKMIRGI